MSKILIKVTEEARRKNRRLYRVAITGKAGTVVKYIDSTMEYYLIDKIFGMKVGMYVESIIREAKVKNLHLLNKRVG